MKIKEARDLSPDELVARKSELRKEAFQLCLQQGSGQLENPSQLTKIRKDVARIETALSERK